MAQKARFFLTSRAKRSHAVVECSDSTTKNFSSAFLACACSMVAGFSISRSM